MESWETGTSISSLTLLVRKGHFFGKEKNKFLFIKIFMV
jgi:hypothetical protein